MIIPPTTNITQAVSVDLISIKFIMEGQLHIVLSVLRAVVVQSEVGKLNSEKASWESNEALCMQVCACVPDCVKSGGGAKCKHVTTMGWPVGDDIVATRILNEIQRVI